MISPVLSLKPQNTTTSLLFSKNSTGSRYLNESNRPIQSNPRQQKFNEMNGAHLASPIRENLVMLIGPSWELNLLPYWAPNLGPIRQQDVCPNFALTAAKFVFSNSGNFRAKANPPKPRSCPKRPFGQ